MRASAVVGVALLSALLASGGCSEIQTCSDVGCNDNVAIRLSYADGYEQLRNSSLTVCQNQNCLSGSLAGLPAQAPETGVGTSTTFPAGNDQLPDPYVELVVFAQGDGLELNVSWNVRSTSELKDGDDFSVSLTPSDATPVNAFTGQVAHYTITSPNGEACGPTCKYFAFDAR